MFSKLRASLVAVGGDVTTLPIGRREDKERERHEVRITAGASLNWGCDVLGRAINPTFGLTSHDIKCKKTKKRNTSNERRML